MNLFPKQVRSAAHHSAQRRDVGAEREFETDHHPIAWLADREPTPDEAVAVSEQLKILLDSLHPVERRMLELRLSGESLQDIAAATDRSERTVRRLVKRVKTDLASTDNETDLNPSIIDRAVAPSIRRNLLAKPRDVEIPPIEDPVRWDDFVLQRQIGFGGMAKVYRAFQKSTQRHVAVKFLRKSFMQHALAIRQFLNEARLIERLRHPNIVAIHGLGQTPAGGYFIVMELIDATAANPDGSRPSQIDAAWGPICETTDVYGLGAVLFTLLTGRPPSVGTMVADILAATVCGNAIVTPSRLNPNVTPQVSAICECCLERKPENRFSTAMELRNAILESIPQLSES